MGYTQRLTSPSEPQPEPPMHSTFILDIYHRQTLQIMEHRHQKWPLSGVASIHLTGQSSNHEGFKLSSADPCRYIAIESGSRLSLTGSVTPDIHDGLRKLICPSLYDEDHTSAFYKVSRLYGAADILDKMHTALNNPTGDSAADAQHIMLLLETASNLQAIVTKDIGYTDEVYSGALSLCNT